MNTLLLTLMLLSPNQATIDNEVKLQTAHAVNVIQLENQAHLKKQIIFFFHLSNDFVK